MLENSIQLTDVMERVANFSENQELLTAFHTAVQDPNLWEMASKEPEEFLRSQGVNIPDELTVRFLEDPGKFKPTPDYEFSTIRFVNCRTYWLKKRDGPGYEKVEICRGFEIVSKPSPGSPTA